jgi:Cof subfamily protein (haloacid dehalogenase superfamily)
MKKVCFFDIDRTIYNPESKSIPSSTLKAIKEMANREDVLIVIATGRAKYMFHVIEPIIDYVDVFITINGAFIYTRDRVLHDEPMNQESVAKIVDILSKTSLKYGFLGRDHETLNIVDEKTKQAFELVDMPLPDVDPYFYTRHTVYQMWVMTDNKIEKKIEQSVNDVSIVRWLGSGFDLVSSHMSKQKGIDIVLEYFNLSIEDAIAIGDGDNDVEMLSYIPLSISMGNGSEKAKKAASFITDSIEEDGFFNALVRFNLISGDCDDC